MYIENASGNKKWLLGPWNSQGPVEIGHLTKARGTAHFHSKVFEYYLIAEGWLNIRVSGKEFVLKQGDVCLIEPGEVHSITKTSEELRCFLVKFPHAPEDKTVVKETP